MSDQSRHGAPPVVAVVGRPNVGKSSLVNRIIGRRAAVVDDAPGVTRDRVAYDADWRGRQFVVVDTGGWEPGAAGLQATVTAQAQTAVEAADLILFVVDASVGVTDTDESVARVLRRSHAPVLLAANKVDDVRAEADATALWSLGLGQPHMVSALHGRGSGDLLDAIVDAVPSAPREVRSDAGPRRIALVGRPNVGKSTLLNRLSRSERAVVDAAPGTTRDPIDEVVVLGGETWCFVDTAGLRRRARSASGAEYYSVLRTGGAIAAAEAAVVLLDASEPLTEQDQRVISTVISDGRALVIAFNKWDLVDEDRRPQLERERARDLDRVSWAPRVNISARTGRGVERLAPLLRQVLAAWEKRVPTGELNTWLGELTAAHPHPVRGGRQPKLFFVTQPAVAPPRLVFFASGPVDPTYQRFLERRLRESFGFEGSPLEITVRQRRRRPVS
jgi:GTP-binding protein